MKFAALTLVGSVAIGSLAIAAPSQAQAPSPSPAPRSSSAASAVAKTEIKGTLGARARGYSVLLVSPKGQAIKTTSDPTTGRFRLVVARTIAAGATLQLVSTSGRYAGPIVLDVDRITTKQGKSYFAHLELTGASVDLGAIGVPVGAHYALARDVTSVAYSRAAVRADAEGAPYGTGRSGLVKRKAQVTTLELQRLSGTVARSARAGRPTGVGPGEDQDQDGIPNFVDVDDNGNQSLDLADPASGATSGLSTWSDLRLSASAPFNAHLGEVTSEDVAVLIGTPHQFNVMFFVEQMSLAQDNDPGTIDYAYVDCGGLAYCGGSSPTAVVDDLTSEQRPIVDWSSFRGGAASENGDPLPQGATTAIIPEGKRNAMQAIFRNEDRGQGPQISTLWLAFMNPNTIADTSGGRDTFDQMHVGDVYNLTYRLHGETGERILPMTLSPFAATVPGVISVNGSPLAQGSDEITLDGDGKAAFSFYRPQRLTVEGEQGTFKDLGGMYYGLILGQEGVGMEYGCSVQTDYSDLRLLKPRPGLDASNPADSLWPLVDTIPTDLPVSQEASVGFTVDVEQCIRDHNNGQLPAGRYSTNIVAAGQNMTGGANRATVGLSVVIR